MAELDRERAYNERDKAALRERQAIRALTVRRAAGGVVCMVLGLFSADPASDLKLFGRAILC